MSGRGSGGGFHFKKKKALQTRKRGDRITGTYWEKRVKEVHSKRRGFQKSQNTLFRKKRESEGCELEEGAPKGFGRCSEVKKKVIQHGTETGVSRKTPDKPNLKNDILRRESPPLGPHDSRPSKETYGEGCGKDLPCPRVSRPPRKVTKLKGWIGEDIRGASGRELSFKEGGNIENLKGLEKKFSPQIRGGGGP